jgi:hypothetical protein
LIARPWMAAVQWGLEGEPAGGQRCDAAGDAFGARSSLKPGHAAVTLDADRAQASGRT